ncbi:uncharacterized protein NEMAJ01_1011 [Nematocida major]|uniref:uncharacterized protein n=1 Tax=Nematocida major TaxID=1912982 RepID=UPI00200808FC|nr:uncharacterized protein NEMAJ01_1011 [Nematocida major]KAH9386115.1 hypothetical protein NEMAJ01_1011 [Nematocida major]
MKKIQHIGIKSKQLRHLLFLDAVESEAKGPTNTVLNAISPHIKNSLNDIPEEKRSEVNAEVDTFLQKNLKPIFSTIAKKYCVVSPKLVEIFTKEATAEVPSELAHGIPVIRTKIIEPYGLRQEVTYEDFSTQSLKKNIELTKAYRETQRLAIFHSAKAIQSKGITKFNKTQLKTYLSEDKNNLTRLNSVLNDLLKEKEEKEEKEKEKCAEENSLDLKKYTLDRIIEKAKGYYSSDEFNQSLYFALKEIVKENGKNITTPKLQFMLAYKNSPSAERVEAAEKNCVYRKMSLVEFYENVHGPLGDVIDDFYANFRSIISLDAGSKLTHMQWKARSDIKEDFEESEKAEIEEFLDAMEEFDDKMNIIVYTFFANLYRIHDGFRMADSPSNMLSAWSREEFEFFTKDFKKMMVRFPTIETNSGFGKAFHALMSCAYKKNERARQLHRNAMRAEECLALLRTSEAAGKAGEDYEFRICEYEKFAEENPVPEFSGSIEDIPSEVLEDGVTPREIQTTILSLKMFHDMYTEQLKDEAKTDSERVELKKSLSETEEKIRVLEERIRSFADLSEEEAKKEECLRYAYLMKYKIECLKHIDVLKKEAEAEMVPLAKKVMKEIEETPNSPEFNREAKKMLVKVLKNEPHRLMTPRFFVRNKHFAEELPKLLARLDEKIVKTLGGSSSRGTDEGSSRRAILRNTFIGAFLITVLGSLKAIFNSKTA